MKVATRFKKDEEAVRAPERFASMLLQRRSWAVSNGLSPEAIEKMYRDLVGYYLEEELKVREKR